MAQPRGIATSDAIRLIKGAENKVRAYMTLCKALYRMFGPTQTLEDKLQRLQGMDAVAALAIVEAANKSASNNLSADSSLKLSGIQTMVEGAAEDYNDLKRRLQKYKEAFEKWKYDVKLETNDLASECATVDKAFSEYLYDKDAQSKNERRRRANESLEALKANLSKWRSKWSDVPASDTIPSASLDANSPSGTIRSNLATLRSRLEGVRKQVDAIKSITSLSELCQVALERDSTSSSVFKVKSVVTILEELASFYRSKEHLRDDKQRSTLLPRVADFIEEILNVSRNIVKASVEPLLKGNAARVKTLKDTLQAYENAVELASPSNAQGPNNAEAHKPEFSTDDVRQRLQELVKMASDESEMIKDASIASQGYLYRKPDADRMSYYIMVVENFLAQLDTSTKPDAAPTRAGLLVSEAESLAGKFSDNVKAVNEEIAKLSQLDDEAHKAFATRRLAKQKCMQARTYAKRARSIMARYTSLHVDFELKDNRQGMRYMSYWTEVNVNNSAVREKLKKYYDLLAGSTESVSSRGEETLNKMLGALLKPLTNKAEVKMLAEEMEDDDIAATADIATGLGAWVLESALTRVKSVHLGAPTVFDVLADTQIIVIYMLKALRFGLWLLALAIARRSFQAMYNRAVYVRNTDPPHPALFVAIAMGLDASFTAVTALGLVGMQYVAGGPGSSFVVDGYLLSRWGLDYVSSTLVIAVLAFVISDIVRSRKYFRYQYEGERGVRALDHMLRYLAGIVILVPFYRMAD